MGGEPPEMQLENMAKWGHRRVASGMEMPMPPDSQPPESTFAALKMKEVRQPC